MAYHHRRDAPGHLGLGLGLGVRKRQGAGGFSPPDLSNLVRWWDAFQHASSITESSGDVSEWRDILGSGDDWEQADNARQPLLTTDSGFDAVLFSGSGDVMLIPTFTASFTEYTFFKAWRLPAGTSGTDTYLRTDLTATTAIQITQNASDTYLLTNSATAGSTLSVSVTNPKGTARSAQITRSNNSGTGDLEFDDGTTASDTNVGTLRNADNAFLGASSAIGSGAIQAYYYEFGFYDRKLTDEERTQLMDYLKSKWSIT